MFKDSTRNLCLLLPLYILEWKEGKGKVKIPSDITWFGIFCCSFSRKLCGITILVLVIYIKGLETIILAYNLIFLFVALR